MSADQIDNACDLEEQHREIAIQNHKNQTHDPLVIDGVRVCLDCGDDITARIEILPDVVRCIFCQEQFERQLGMKL